ncbi:MAG: hypothetical protein AB8Z23_01370 [Coxiella-like endosymbiont]
MKRSLVSVALASVAIVIVYLLVPSFPIIPRGVFLTVAPSKMSFVPSEVNFYNPVTAPCAYKKIGYINVQFYSKGATPEGEAQLQQYVREIAAKAGANGVIVMLFGHTIPGAVRVALSSYVFRGTAIYVIPNV